MTVCPPPKIVPVLPPSRASPLPQGGLDQAGNSGHTTNQCGSWLVCDDGMSATKNSACTTAIAGKPAPTGGGSTRQGILDTPQTNVGAGLPAMTVCPPPKIVPVLPPSRASPLPQGELDQAGNSGHTTNQCGSWLACDDGMSATKNSACTTAIAGKPAPTGGARPGREFWTHHKPMWELACLR